MQIYSNGRKWRGIKEPLEEGERGEWKSCMQVKKQHLEPDMKQSTGSKLGKEYDKVVYCYPAI